MSYECKNLSGTFCEKRKQECDPGAKGCVLEGKFSFPLKENGKKKGYVHPKCCSAKNMAKFAHFGHF